MKNVTLSRCALFAGCVMVAACSQATQLSPLQYTPNVSSAPKTRISPLSYGLLYTFGAPPDGAEPEAGLIDVGGTLYGTTASGGKYGYGTVFKLTAGKDKVLHNFGSFSSDGEKPMAGLINVNGTLYGTTVSGGKYGHGTVFSISSSGYEVLYPFGKGGAADGESPVAGLVDVGGTLYGTTYFGGLYANGTVFSATTGGAENVLYSFGAGNDASTPNAALIGVSGTLYGTTTNGGKYSVFGGTVFSITTSGKNEKILHSFGNGSDGNSPHAGLIYAYGLLYGTTYNGGTKCLKSGGCGTVFSVTTGSKSTETVLHNFSGGAVDGANPVAGLTFVSGALFGTTVYGGKFGSYGTVFTIDLRASNKEDLLHSFGVGLDGLNPEATLIYEAGNLVGTTYGGGYGNGTVFSLPAFMAMAPCFRCQQRNAAF
jgi:uncharacterized repeat protein (TIGR03803 family)